MFDTLPVYRPTPETEGEILQAIGEQLAEKTGEIISAITTLNTGQNPSYQIFVAGSPDPAYFLKIIARKGYPSLPALVECSECLRSNGLPLSDLVCWEDGDSIVPYGFLVQPWFAGDTIPDEIETFEWLDDFARFLRSVRIEMPDFGYLGNGPHYPTMLAYFEQMDEVIDHSFGDGFLQSFSVWQLQATGLTSPGFLDRTFERVRELAQSIEAEPLPILIHGDMLPTNLIYASGGNLAIDWDECRAHWWVYEVARTLYYYPENQPEILERFLAVYGDEGQSMSDIQTCIRLEHVRQHLRVMCIGAFNMQDRAVVQSKVAAFEEGIERLLGEGAAVNFGD